MNNSLLHRRRLLVVFCLWIAASLPAYGQLNTVFSDIFNEILGPRLSLSPGFHSNHFKPAAEQANAELVPALNSLITGNISSFPLSSTSAGVLFDFSSGEPVRVTESLGPILAETGKTLGKGKFLAGANFTYLNLSRLRGLSTDQMQFTFTHQLVQKDTALGQNPNESDLIDVVMDLHTRVSIGAIFATIGVTNDLDLSVAIPIISVHLNGTAAATIGSYTFAEGGGTAHHFYGGDSSKPVLVTTLPYDESATGLGDVALRVKYNLARGGSVDVASLLDIRFPTGKEEDFRGSGKPTYRLWAILSSRMGDVTPHLNVGYTRKPAELQSDALEFRVGFDNKLSSKLTFALDILGQIDLNKSEAIHLAPGTATIIDKIEPGRIVAPPGVVPQSIRVVNLSNIPDRTNDNTYAAAIGFRYAPSDPVIVFGNILIPLNDGGLRAQIAPTIGISVSL